MSDLNQILVVPVVMEKHPDADSLSLVAIDGYTCVVRTSDWEGEDRAAYIPPDNVVDVTRPEFKFLDQGIQGRTTARIKAKRLRGIMSQGLLVPIPKWITEVEVTDIATKVKTGYMFNIGDDVTEYFGVTRYVSAADLRLDAGPQASGPPTPGVKYDIESWFKYKRSLPEGTMVVLTEKLHGTNARFTFQEGEMHVGSRSFYRKKEENSDNLYWRALKENPWIEEFCRANEGVVLYGEIFGWVQELRYGAQQGQIFFKAFDVYDRGQFWAWYKFWDGITNQGLNPDRVVPVVIVSPINDDLIERHMNGKSLFYSGHIREGVVIKPVVEMVDRKLGRVIVKVVSPAYLEKAA